MSVAGLARTIGGLAAAITAAAVGVAVAALLGIPLGSRTSRSRLGKLDILLTAALVITALAVAGLFAYDAASIQNRHDTRSAIKKAILKSYDAELRWYEDPTHRPPDLDKWFVRPSAGGERLTIVEAAAARLRRCHRKIGSKAASTTFIDTITVSGSDAEAHTVQSLFQPVLDFRNGRWVERQLPPADLMFYVPDQVYLLKRIAGRWKVQSAPQQQNVQRC